MKDRLKAAIEETLLQSTELEAPDLPAFTVEVPKEKGHGDFATNVALVCAKKLKTAPRKLAEKLLEGLSALDFVERVEIAGPGFINFFLASGVVHSVLVDILSKGADYGRGPAGDQEKIMVEFVSANPTGPLHFGHGRGAVVGDVLANLLEFSGRQVAREYYVNDAGGQVRAPVRSVVFRAREQLGLSAELPAEFPEDGYRGDYVKELAAGLPDDLTTFLPGEPSDDQLQAIQDHAVAAMLNGIQKELSDFGVKMDQYSSEVRLVDSGRVEETFGELEKRGLLEERDGARWFLSDKFKDEKPRVLVKSDGSHTYFATDIGYHLDKLRRGFGRLINIWGADHHGYVPRMKAALMALGHPGDALEIVLVQMVSLVRGGQPVVLSKRGGEFVTLREVVDEVGRDAARFFFLLRGCDSQMEFDLELAKKRSLENPVFYVQYGHARLSSILAKAAERNIPVPQTADGVDLDLLKLEEELALIKKTASFGDRVTRAANARAPHQIVFYLQELVSDFHHYYTAYAKTNPILKGDPKQIAARLILVQALRQVLRNALGLLGVSAPDRMESLAEEEE
jgi:arginyl-tRNA synthetase